MPLKTPKKPLSKKPQQTDDLDNILQLRTDKGNVIETANALTKAIGADIDTTASHRLLNRLKKDITCSNIRDYTDFVKDEWHELRQFLPNYGVRGNTKIIDKLSLSVLCDYYGVVVSLYKTCRHSRAEYLTRIGELPFDDLEAAKDKENPERSIASLRLLNKKAADVINKQRKEINELKVAVASYKTMGIRTTAFAVRFIGLHSIPIDSFLNWVSDRGSIEDMGELPRDVKVMAERIDNDIKIRKQ